MAIVNVDGSSLLADSQAKPVGLIGMALVLSLHSSNELSEF